MLTGSSGRGKVSSLGQLSGAKQPTPRVCTTSTTRKRKVQPALKERAEAFLANAVSDTTFKTNQPKKRKLKECQDERPPKPQATLPKDQTASVSTPKSRSKTERIASDNSPKKDDEKRLRRYREKAPKTFLEKLGRAQNQRYPFRFIIETFADH